MPVGDSGKKAAVVEEATGAAGLAMQYVLMGVRSVAGKGAVDACCQGATR